jgi:hypothetical protein
VVGSTTASLQFIAGSGWAPESQLYPTEPPVQLREVSVPQVAPLVPVVQQKVPSPTSALQRSAALVSIGLSPATVHE